MAAPIVFVTRKYPPSVGGMESLAESLWTSLEAARPGSRLIANRGSNKRLWYWLPLLALRLLWLRARTGRVDDVLVGDALTYAVVSSVPGFRHDRVVPMVMGLDVTYRNGAYRMLVHRALRRAHRVVAISEATRGELVAAGTDPDRVEVLALGTRVPTLTRNDRVDARNAMLQRLGLQQDTFLLLTLGRLVARKGVRWFVTDVMPELPDNVHYVVVGAGPEEAAIRKAVADHGLSARVHVLGRVSDEMRECCMRGADLFVQPNVSVRGDIEGFGLVTIEAGVRGTPVVASDIEGLKDAIVPDVTGTLLPSGDKGAWTAAVTAAVHDDVTTASLGWARRDAVIEEFSDSAMVQRLLDILEA